MGTSLARRSYAAQAEDVKYALIIAFVFVARAAFGQEGMWASDVMLDQMRLTKVLLEQVVEFYDGSKSTYRENGRYEYA